MKAYLTKCHGIESIVPAQSQGKARAITFRSAVDAGYKVLWTDIIVRRAPKYDRWATVNRKEQCYSVESICLELES